MKGGGTTLHSIIPDSLQNGYTTPVNNLSQPPSGHRPAPAPNPPQQPLTKSTHDSVLLSRETPYFPFTVNGMMLPFSLMK